MPSAPKMAAQVLTNRKTSKIASGDSSGGRGTSSSASSETEDVPEGEEPGAGRGAMLAQTDSYDDIATFLGPAAHCDPPSSNHDWKNKRRVPNDIVEPIPENGTVVNDEEAQLSCDEMDSIIERADANVQRIETISLHDEYPKGNDSPCSSADLADANATVPHSISANSVAVTLQKQLSSSSTDGGEGCSDIESCTKESWKQHKNHVFILSSAGKPIYTRYGDEADQASVIGVLQALFMSYRHSEDCRDSLMSINAGRLRFVFLYREPLILVAASNGGGESQHQLEHQLLYAYYQIVFVLTSKRIDAYFKDRTNYDLRRQLTGVDRFTDNLMHLCDTDPSFLLSAVRSLPLDSPTRDVIAHTMYQNCKVKNLVFAILLADNQLVTIVRHRNYFLHPIELHLIFNLVSKTEAFKGSETWVPVCLPKFDANGFLYAYISYLDDALNACLVLLTVDSSDFATLSQSRINIQQRLVNHKCLEVINEAVKRKNYSMRSVGVPEMRHFLYKSKSASLCTSPDYDAPYTTEEERNRLMSLYRHVHHRTHCTSPSPQLKMYFVRGPVETCIGWITSGFEVYAIFGPLVSKQDTIIGVSKLLRWIKKEEDKLFILNTLTVSVT